MNTIQRLALGELALSISMIILVRKVYSHEERITNMERPRLKTAEEIREEVNKLIKTGKIH